MNKQIQSIVLVIIFSSLFCVEIFSLAQKDVLFTEEIKIDGSKGFYNYFPLPVEVKFDSKNIYILDASDHQIVVLTKSGKYKQKIGKRGKGPGEFDMPSGMDLFEEQIYIADKMNRRIQILDKSGNYLKGFNIKFSPEKIAVLREDCIIVSTLPLLKESEVKMIFCFNQNGQLLWNEFNSFYSGEKIYDLFRNRLNMEITQQRELAIAKKNNDRNIYIFNHEGMLSDNIRITQEYSLKEIVIPAGKNKKLSNFYSDFALSDHKFYLLTSQFISEDGKKDLVPGDKIYIFGLKGNILGIIQLPDRFKLINVDNLKIYGIDCQNQLRILKIKNEKTQPKNSSSDKFFRCLGVITFKWNTHFIGNCF